MTQATDPDHFERLYAANPDPWAFTSSAYEREKYAATLAALPDRRFVNGLEVGCSVGVLTTQLATRCDTLLGLDGVEAAVGQARASCAAQPWVRIERSLVPADWPGGRFDLIVFSEVLYYLGSNGLRQTASLARDSLLPGGVIALVNWLGDTGTGYDGAQAAHDFIVACALRHDAAKQTEQYRIDLLFG